jgi:hypothetical protein
VRHPPPGPWYVLECDVRPTPLGRALRVQIERHDGARMGWEELHAVFVAHYPGRWAVQCFPPLGAVLNGANKYHLFVLLDGEPAALDIGRDPPVGTVEP